MSADNWILTYYQQICDGSVTVGSWIRRWYEYVVHGLEEKRFFFDQRKAARAIAFIQQYCRHHEGPLAPQLIQLETWQKGMDTPAASKRSSSNRYARNCRSAA